MISSININFCGIFGGLEDQVWIEERREVSVHNGWTVCTSPTDCLCVTLSACRARREAAPRAPAGPTAASNLPATPPLPPSDPPETPSLPCLLLHPSHGGGNFPHQIHHQPYRSSPEDHQRTSPTSFSTTPSTSSSPETKEKAIPKLLHLLPQAPWLNKARSTPTPPYANMRPIARALLIVGELPSPLTISLSSICNFISHPWNLLVEIGPEGGRRHNSPLNVPLRSLLLRGYSNYP
jgi:hypothetical protein